jgi:hypothetical protein
METSNDRIARNYEPEWRAAPREWNNRKICQHCWHYRDETCGGRGCIKDGVKGYFTIQQMPKK